MPPPHTDGHLPQVRAGSLTSYVSLAQSVGLDGFAMLREFKIEPQLLRKPEYRISANAVSALLAETACRSGCEAFGLLLAEKRSFSSLGPLSLLLRHESSLRAVLRRLIAYRRLVSDILEFDVVEDGDEARILIWVTPDVATRQCVEFATALTYRFLSGAIFGGWHPAGVHFRHPPPADTAIHQRVFRAPLHFDATFNGFVFPAEALDRENAYGDTGFAEHAQHYVDLLARKLPQPSLQEQVRSAIKQLLPHGTATLPRVAAQLNVHPRTLQRKLAASGLAFAQLVESMRECSAQDLLANTNLPVGDVALLVGYSSPASFSRWFAGAIGEPPREWRQHNRPRSAA